MCFHGDGDTLLNCHSDEVSGCWVTIYNMEDESIVTPCGLVELSGVVDGTKIYGHPVTWGTHTLCTQVTQTQQGNQLMCPDMGTHTSTTTELDCSINGSLHSSGTICCSQRLKDYCLSPRRCLPRERSTWWRWRCQEIQWGETASDVSPDRSETWSLLVSCHIDGVEYI